MAKTKTPPAEISFANLAFSLYSGLTISTTVSIAVLKSSPEMTIPKQTIHKIHSNILILKINPDKITKIIIVKWIFKFLSVFIEEKIHGLWLGYYKINQVSL